MERSYATASTASRGRKKELDDKLNMLKAFIETNPVFEDLPADERGRLGRQFDVMAEYSSILSQRIAAFPA